MEGWVDKVSRKGWVDEKDGGGWKKWGWRDGVDRRGLDGVDIKMNEMDGGWEGGAHMVEWWPV